MSQGQGSIQFAKSPLPPGFITFGGAANGLSLNGANQVVLGGTLSADTTINNGPGSSRIILSGTNFDSGTPMTIAMNPSDNGFLRVVGSDAGSFIGSVVQNTIAGGGSGAGYKAVNDLGHVMQFEMNSSSNAFGNDMVEILSSGGAGGMAFCSTVGPFLFANTANAIGGEIAQISHAGQLGIGVSPTAYIHIRAGSAAPGTAPFKLTGSPLLATPETGAMEFNGANLSFTRVNTREDVITGLVIGTPPAFNHPAVALTAFYGAVATGNIYLAVPDDWLQVVTSLGTFRIPLYA